MKSKRQSQKRENKEELKREIISLVEKYSEFLLPGWRIEIFFQKTPETQAAICHPLHFFSMAKITFDIEKREWEDPVFREIGVIHELLHCATSGWAMETEETISRYVGEELQDEVRERFSRAEEKEITDIAWGIFRAGKMKGGD